MAETFVMKSGDYEWRITKNAAGRPHCTQRLLNFDGARPMEISRLNDVPNDVWAAWMEYDAKPVQNPTA